MKQRAFSSWLARYAVAGLTAIAALMVSTAELNPAQADALPPTARLVTYEDFANRIVGQKMRTKIGKLGVTAIFHPDGTLKVSALVGKASGTWYFDEQQKICMWIRSVDQQAEGCHHLFDLGDGKTFQGDGGRQWVMR